LDDWKILFAYLLIPEEHTVEPEKLQEQFNDPGKVSYVQSKDPKP
jgi:hypothetical protein